MSASVDAAKDLVVKELSLRVREAVQLKDWIALEYWAKQWIQVDGTRPDGFKWLARASLAQNKLKRAAYAYNRLLDFDSDNAEAIKFFTDYPSQSERETPATPVISDTPNKVNLTLEQRKNISLAQFELAKRFEEAHYYADAASHYQASFEWRPSQSAGLAAARCLHRSQRGLEAVRFLRTQLANYADWTDGRVLLGRILFELGNRADAQREWQLVLRTNPTHQETLNFVRGLYTSYL